jgi:translation initiation factor 1 (eIF-1/SUI1)
VSLSKHTFFPLSDAPLALRALVSGAQSPLPIVGVAQDQADGIRKGTMQPITLSVKTRQGRKVVTVITGLETYSIKVDEFAEDLKRICAGSASSESITYHPECRLRVHVLQCNQVKRPFC